MLLPLASCVRPKFSASLINKEPSELKRLRQLASSDKCMNDNGSFNKCLKNNSIPSLDWVFMGEDRFSSSNPSIYYHYIANPRRMPFSDVVIFNYLGIIINQEFDDNYKIILHPPGYTHKFNCETFEYKVKEWDFYSNEFTQTWSKGGMIDLKTPNYRTFEKYKSSKHFLGFPRFPSDTPEVTKMLNESEEKSYRLKMQGVKNFNYICKKLIK